MGLEVGTYISDLVATNPLGSDEKSLLDDHIRLLKTTLTNTFIDINAEITVTDTEINYLSSVASNIQTSIDGKASATSTITAGTVVLAPSGSTSITIDISAGVKDVYYSYKVTSSGNTVYYGISGSGFNLDAYIKQTGVSYNDVLVIVNNSGLSSATVSFAVKGWR